MIVAEGALEDLQGPLARVECLGGLALAPQDLAERTDRAAELRMIGSVRLLDHRDGPADHAFRLTETILVHQDLRLGDKELCLDREVASAEPFELRAGKLDV